VNGIDDYFASTYGQARAKFREAAVRAGARLGAFEMPFTTGLYGETLATDVAWLGSNAPRGAIMVTAGTHGVEGFAGSGFQCWLLSEGISVAQDDVAVILVHAVNPYGFSHACRVNEYNVDLNRNFIDFAQVPSTSERYEQLHGSILPARWSGEHRSLADEQLEEAWRLLGERGFQDAVCRGQYSHADGLFYGGRAPSWSNHVWRACLANLPQALRIVAHIDLHTGLGPFGLGEIVYTLPMDAPALEIARQWYEDLGMRTAGSAQSVTTPVRGTMNHAVIDAGLQAQTTSISVEFGTVEFRRMFEALRADNWLRQSASATPAEAAGIRREVVECFYPRAAGWKSSVIERCSQVFNRTVAGVVDRLGAGDRDTSGK
jgi:predicted deacylase